MKKVAVLALCVVMFAAVQPACATTYGDSPYDTTSKTTIKAVIGVIGNLLDAFLGTKRERDKITIKSVLMPTTTVPTR